MRATEQRKGFVITHAFFGAQELHFLSPHRIAMRGVKYQLFANLLTRTRQSNVQVWLAPTSGQTGITLAHIGMNIASTHSSVARWSRSNGADESNMTTGIWSAASGAVSQMTALDVAANNVANVGTNGYRADRALFQQVLNRAKNDSAGSRSMLSTVTRTLAPDFMQGQFLTTGRALDVALGQPDAWFVVQTSQGERYTRAGSIQVAADGTLTTPEGYAYLSTNHAVIRARSDARSIAIASDGKVTVDDSETNQQLAVVKFSNSDGLVKEGSILLRATPAAGRPQPMTASIEVATLESSNSTAMGGMNNLVQSSRDFEMLAKVIEAFSQVEQRTAQEVARK